MNKKNFFKSSLSVPIFEAYNKSIFNLLKSKSYENYTDVVLSTLGKNLENYFSSSDFRLKYRYKSKKSFYANILKDSSNEDLSSAFNKYITYDIIGMRLVIENIPDNFNINERFIKKSKIQIHLLKEKLSCIQKDFCNSNNSELTDKLNTKITFINNKITYLNSCINFKNLLNKKILIQKDIDLMDKKLAKSYNPSLAHEKNQAFLILESLNNSLGLIAGHFAICDILENSEELHKLGIYLDSSREKYFNDSNGYNSIHFCLKSSLYPAWVAELQDRSSIVEYISKYGPTIHDKIPGKKRKLHPLPLSTNTSDVHRYISHIKYILPKYTKYVYNGYIKKYTKKENVQHYYKKLFLENAEYSKIANEILFDRPTITYLPTFDNICSKDIKTNEK